MSDPASTFDLDDEVVVPDENLDKNAPEQATLGDSPTFDEYLAWAKDAPREELRQWDERHPNLRAEWDQPHIHVRFDADELAQIREELTDDDLDPGELETQADLLWSGVRHETIVMSPEDKRVFQDARKAFRNRTGRGGPDGSKGSDALIRDLAAIVKGIGPLPERDSIGWKPQRHFVDGDTGNYVVVEGKNEILRLSPAEQDALEEEERAAQAARDANPLGETDRFGAVTLRLSDVRQWPADRFFALSLGPIESAKQAGFSRQSAWRLMRGLDGVYPVARSLAEAERRDELQPDPKAWDSLDGGVRDTLADFNLFCETFLLRRPVAWRKDAAERVVEALQDRTTRSYMLLNMPPGSGKSTLFTHDIPVWLIAGGGLCDPLRGRAVRIMLGSFGYKIATHYVQRVQRVLESPRAFYDKATSRRAELSLVQAFGRFKPRQPGISWKADEFIVEQLEQIDLSEKEPTVQAASRESGFLGERVNVGIWDDLVVSANVRSVEVRTDLARWAEDEVETRVEPGGCLLLVGQRLGPDDLYRSRLDVSYTDDDGVTRRKYQHVRYPAHNDATCDAAHPDGSHRQWDVASDGCLLDAERLPWTELQAERASNPRKFRIIMQQEDVDIGHSLVDPAWLEGGEDRDGFLAPGCYDTERGFMQWPERISGLVNYVTVDPSAGNYWGVEWWAIQPETKVRYLIRGFRSASFKAGDLLQWNTSRSDLTGLMQEWQIASVKQRHPIRCWVIEGNSAFKHLTQYDHFRTWQHRHGAAVILHQTQRNKNDEQTGVEALLPPLYRQGLKRLPTGRHDMDARGFTIKFAKELVEYPDSATKDLVMADWMAEWNMAKILALGRRAVGRPIVVDAQLPPYLANRQHELSLEDASAPS